VDVLPPLHTTHTGALPGPTGGGWQLLLSLCSPSTAHHHCYGLVPPIQWQWEASEVEAAQTIGALVPGVYAISHSETWTRWSFFPL
jgi:hypothetical protein